jgi:antitoxin MazE
MTTSIRDIGNSKGIILPKNILAQCEIGTDVSIEVKHNSIIITATPKPKRKGWEKAFKEMAKNGDDALAIPDVFIDENIDD